MQNNLDYVRLEFNTAHEFVLEHNHIRYCEAIITPDGLIAPVHTSHQNMLLKLFCQAYNISLDDAWIKLSAVPFDVMNYLITNLNIVAVWYDFSIGCVNNTHEQRQTLEYLIQTKTVAPNHKLSEKEVIHI